MVQVGVHGSTPLKDVASQFNVGQLLANTKHCLLLSCILHLCLHIPAFKCLIQALFSASIFSIYFSRLELVIYIESIGALILVVSHLL